MLMQHVLGGLADLNNLKWIISDNYFPPKSISIDKHWKEGTVSHLATLLCENYWCFLFVKDLKNDNQYSIINSIASSEWYNCRTHISVLKLTVCHSPLEISYHDKDKD